MSSSKHIPSSIFCKQPICKFTFNFPKKKSSPVYLVKTMSSFPVLLSYIDSRQYLFLIVSCSPTLTADNIFSLCVLLSYIDSGQRQSLYFLCCSPTLMADNIFSFGVLALLHWQRIMSFSSYHVLALLHWQLTMSFSLFHVLLSYIAANNVFISYSCSLTLTANNVFISCPCSLTLTADNILILCLILLHWQQTILPFYTLAVLSHIDGSLHLFFPCFLVSQVTLH
jgi:hypothetical protein